MAYCANLILETNYMFLVRGDGTPYDILYNLTNGGIIYSLLVLLLFIVYIVIFYTIFMFIKKKKKS